MKNLALTLGLASLLSCSQDRSHSDRHELVYWPAANAQEIRLAQAAAHIWNQSHPHFPVRIQPVPESQSTEEVLLAAVVGKTTPDICSNIWPGVMGQFVRARAVIAMDQFADFDSVTSARLPDGQLAPYRFQDGHVYQMPWKTNPIMLEYNAGMLRRAGFDHPPETFSEFIQMGKEITRDLDGDGQTDRWMMYVDTNVKWWLRYFDFYTFYIVASGGKTLVENRQVVFDNAGALEVFRFFRTCFACGIFPQATFQGDTFLAEIVATHVTGPWNIAHVEKFKSEGFEFDYAPIPQPDSATGPVTTYGDPKNIVIFSTCLYPDRAWEFVKFLVSREQDLALLEIASQLPVRKHILTDSLYTNFFQNHPKLAKFAQQAPHTRGVDAVPELREIFDAISQEFEACCILGRRTPEEALARTVERAREILQ